jgi:hypothetical protein
MIEVIVINDPELRLTGPHLLPPAQPPTIAQYRAYAASERRRMRREAGAAQPMVIPLTHANAATHAALDSTD